MNIIKFKAFNKIDKQILDWSTIKQSAFNRDSCQLMYKIIMNYFDNFIILPYWRTIQTSKGTVELYQGDVFQLGIDKYIVRYNYQESMFMIADINDLKKENIWDIWLFFYQEWWIKNQYKITYLGNEYENPELLEEK